MKKYLKLTYCFLIFGTALIPLFATVIGIDSVNLDKSSLTPMPNIIENDRINPSYTLQFDDFFTDQFAFRTFLITKYNEIYANLFKQSGNEKVIVGKDGFLFFEETLNDYLKINTFNDYDLMRLNEILRIQQEFLLSQGINSYFVIVPNKATIYPQYMPSSLKPFNEASNYERIRNMELTMNFIDLKEPLMLQSSQSDTLLYHRQDSHWNNIGAAIGYTVLMESIEKDHLQLMDQSPVKKNDWQGDLTRMLYPAQSTLDQQYYYTMPKQFAFTKAIRTLEDLQIESVNPSKTGNLIMFRDSFANALIPYLSESFAQVNYYRLFPYDYTKIESLSANTLIIEIAERNVNWYFQASPVLNAPVSETMMPEFSTVTIGVTVDLQKKSDMFFINARFDDQLLAERITAVRCADNGISYDAFPVYQDSHIEDDAFEYGFSMYTEKFLDPDTMSIYVRMDNKWHKVIRP